MVAYTSFRANASHSASRVFSFAQTPPGRRRSPSAGRRWRHPRRTAPAITSSNRIGSAIGSSADHLAEEVVLLGGRQRRVRIRRADHAELEWVDPELRLVGEAPLQASRAYSRGSMSLRLGLRTEAAIVPASRSRRTRQSETATGAPRRPPSSASPRRAARTACGAPRRPGPAAPSRSSVDVVEHQAVREVAVVRNGQHAAAGLLLVGRHPLPELSGIRARRTARAGRPGRPCPCRRGR